MPIARPSLKYGRLTTTKNISLPKNYDNNHNKFNMYSLNQTVLQYSMHKLLVRQIADQRTRSSNSATRCFLHACIATKCDFGQGNARSREAFTMLPQSPNPWRKWWRGKKQRPEMGKRKGKEKEESKEGGKGEKGWLSFYSCTVGTETQIC